MKGFVHFLRTQGVAGLAIGFIIGAAAQSTVSALSSDIITPTIGIASGKLGNLASSTAVVAGQTYAWGHFVSAVINLLLVALLVYMLFHLFHLDRLDAKKQ
jgi:large conductance mechanosensitive channel